MLTTVLANWNKDYSGKTEDKHREEPEKKAWPGEEFFFFFEEGSKTTTFFFFFNKLWLHPVKQKRLR